MTTVLITRPHGAAETLASELERRGYASAIEPLLTVRPLNRPSPPLLGVDAVMITSGYALQVFESRPHELAALFGLPCFCVGPRTAQRARRLGFWYVEYGESDGVGLAKMIGEMLERKNSRLLHITGSHTDMKARLALEHMGHHVEEWPVYETAPAHEFSPGALVMFKTHKLDAVTVFSPHTAKTLGGLLVHHALEACCKSLAAICLSPAISDVLKPFTWRRLVATLKPTEENVLACLEEICPVKNNERD